MVVEYCSSPKERALLIVLKFFLVLFFAGYIAFVPIGPYPIMVYGAKLDHLFAFATVVVCVLLAPLCLLNSFRMVCISVLIFLGFALSTSFVSDDTGYSLRNFTVIVGYATIALFAPLIIHEYVSILRQYLLIVAAITASVVIFWYFTSHSQGRMRLHSEVDPNMTAIGLLLCVIFFLPEYFKLKRRAIFGLARTILCTVLPAIILVATVILLSRTAILSFVVALVWGLLCTRWKRRRYFPQQILKKIAIFTFIMLLALIYLKGKSPAIIESYTNRVRFVVGGDLAASEYTRIMYAKQTINLWFENPKNFLIGAGFFTTNPHNEFLRMLGGSGLCGLISFLLMFVAFYVTCCRSRAAQAVHSFAQNALFAYILIMVQFYGHTKSLWVGFTFLLINHIAEERRQAEIQMRRGPQIGVAEGRNSIT